MVFDAVSGICNHILQESVMGECRTGFNFQDDLAAGTVNLIHEVTGFTDSGNQSCNHIPGGFSDQAFAAGNDCQCIFVAGDDSGDEAGFIVFYGDFGIDAQNQNTAAGQRGAVVR